jgi:hypothetical protein
LESIAYQSRPELPLRSPRRPSRHRVAFSIVQDELCRLSTASKAASTLFGISDHLSISLVSYPFPRPNLRCAFLPAREKGCLFQRPGHDLDSCKGGRHGSHLSHLYVLPVSASKKDASQAPPLSKIIFLAHKSIPRKIPKK